MKKAILLLFALTLILALAGCSPDPASEDAMMKDIAEHLDNPSGEAQVTALEVIKRQTDKDAKSDLVYVEVTYDTPAATRVERYKLTYGLYNEGWILDETEPYEQSKWTATPLAGPESRQIAGLLPEGSEVKSDELDLDAGLKTVQYSYPVAYAYCDVTRTEQLQLHFDADMEEWLADAPEMLGEEEDWAKLCGMWQTSTMISEDYGFQAAILPFEGSEPFGYAYLYGRDGDTEYNSDDLDIPRGLATLTELFEFEEDGLHSKLGDGSVLTLDRNVGLVFSWMGQQKQTLGLYEAFETEGTCGDGVTWKMEPEAKLVISGNGPMKDYTSDDDVPTIWGGALDITIGDGVTRVGDNAFADFSMVKTVTLPESLTSIGSKAFANAISLSSVQLPEGIESLGERAFSNCDGLGQITLPASLTEIGQCAFTGCDALASVTVQANAPDAGSFIFSDCPGLLHVTVEEGACLGGMPFIGAENAAFTGDREAVTGTAKGACGESVTWQLTGDGALTISGAGAMTDYGWEYAPWYPARNDIHSIVVEEGVTYLGSDAFAYCGALESVSIPMSVTQISDYAFSGSSGFTILCPENSVAEGFAWENSIACETSVIPAEGTVNEDMSWTLDESGTLTVSGTGAMPDWIYAETPWFWHNGSIRRVVVEEGVTTVGAYAFNGCYFLTEVVLPEGLTSINNDAFCNCSQLASVQVPESLTAIGDRAFGSCWALTAIQLPEDVTVAVDAFIDSGVTVQTAASVEMKQTAQQFIGEDLAQLTAAIGQPNSSEYTASNYLAGAVDGVLTYNGFTVVTLRSADGSEIVMSVE